MVQSKKFRGVKQRAIRVHGYPKFATHFCNLFPLHFCQSDVIFFGVWNTNKLVIYFFYGIGRERCGLGTLEIIEKAVRAYDQATILMSGINANTNFPITQTPEGDPKSTTNEDTPSTTTTVDPTCSCVHVGLTRPLCLYLSYWKILGTRENINPSISFFIIYFKNLSVKLIIFFTCFDKF